MEENIFFDVVVDEVAVDGLTAFLKLRRRELKTPR